MPKETGAQIQSRIARHRFAAEQCPSIGDLPVWVKQALTRMHLEDLTPPKTASQFGRDPKTLNAYIRSPAGQEWIALIKETSNDPREFARTCLTASSANVVSDLFFALELAKKAGDHTAIRQITQYIIDRPEVLGAVQKDAPAAITINISGGASLEPKMIESTHAEVQIEGEAVEGSWEEVDG